MAFELKWTDVAAETFEEIESAARQAHKARSASGSSKSTRAEGLFKQIGKTLELLAQDPRHPGLRTHEYHAVTNPYDPRGKIFEAYAQNNAPSAYRIFWCYGPGAKQITIVAIAPHP